MHMMELCCHDQRLLVMTHRKAAYHSCTLSTNAWMVWFTIRHIRGRYVGSHSLLALQCLEADFASKLTFATCGLPSVLKWQSLSLQDASSNLTCQAMGTLEKIMQPESG